MLKWLIAGLVIWAVWKLLARPRKPRAMPPPGAQEASANALLGVDIHADAQAVRQAYRSRITELHPDRGGSADLTQQLNAARDLLLRMRGE